MGRFCLLCFHCVVKLQFPNSSVLIVKMLGMKSILALSLLILLPDRVNSDEVADAVRAAREKLLENFSKEELAALSDEQINHIIERDTLPQARKIAVTALKRLTQYSRMMNALPESWKVRFLKSQLERFDAEVQLFKSLPIKTHERILSHVLARMPGAEDPSKTTPGSSARSASISVPRPL